MAGDMMIDILRGIGLAVHQEAAIAKTDVLKEDEIGRERCAGGVFQRYLPEPRGFAGVQLEADRVLDAGRLAAPAKAALGMTETHGGLRTDDLGRFRLCAADAQIFRLCAADAQIKPADAAIDGRSEHLIDHDAALLVGEID